MSPDTLLSFKILDIDAESVAAQIEREIRAIVVRQLRRRGAVVGVSGGIDSSVTAILCARALGEDRVVALLMPEDESSSESLTLGVSLSDALGIPKVVEIIGPVLSSLGCYQRRDDAIRKVIPEYGDGWKCKIVLPSLLEGNYYPLFSLIAQSPDGKQRRVRLTPEAYLGIVAATNFKQRIRKTLEYFHADNLHYAVAGTPNRLEYALGFFVKNGDGSADFKPIAHLYKTQVYQLARYLRIPQEIIERPPTTDTYSLEQSQEEFYFSMPLETMDLCLYAKEHGFLPEETAFATGLSVEQAKRVYEMIDSRRNATRYLHLAPLLIEPVDGMS